MVELFFAPHPDDEVLGCGGTIAKHVKLGATAYVCVVTRGCSPLFSFEETEKTRQEQKNAHHILGVKETVYLDFPAVMLEEQHRYEINERIFQVIQKIKPEAVYIPHFGDMQKDHAIVSEAVMVAIRPKHGHKVKRVYAYETLSETEWNIPHVANVFLPTVYEDISQSIDQKIEALRVFQSQLLPFPSPRSEEAAIALAKLRGSTIQVDAAEAFALIRAIR